MERPHAEVGRSRWRAVFFAGLFAYFYVLGSTNLPKVHYFYDAVAIRDMATVWHSLTWNIKDEKHFLPAAVLGQHEGMLQFLLLNLYAHLVGDIFPLNPRTMQVPNTVLAWASAVVLYLLGRRLHSERVGYLSALTFALLPWLGMTIRLPWVFNLLSVLTQAVALYFYLGLALEPDRRLYRVGAPLSLALYLTTGVDWPSFVFVLGLFLLLTGRLGPALKNVHNLYPLAVLAIYAAWTVALFVYGRWYAPERAHLYQRAILVFPFFKVATTGGVPSLGQVAKYAVDTLGLPFLFALAGVVSILRAGWARGEASGVGRRFLLAMSIWFVVASVPLLKVSNSVTFGYVLGVSTPLLAALALARVRTSVVVLVAVGMLAGQLHTVWTRGWRTFDDRDRRVLAAAAFLIEKRPDLLARDRVAFLPRNIPSNVGQYARGQNERIVMPVEFPLEMKLHAVGSKEELLREFVTVYAQRGEIKADWLILSSELLSDGNRAAGFYRRLRADPGIHWVATFADEHGRALWVGEVHRQGQRGQPPGAYDVEALARAYERKYDRISFLRRNVRFVFND